MRAWAFSCLKGAQRLSAACALVVALGQGCAPLEPLPEKDIAELLPVEKGTWNEPLRFTRGPGAEFNGDYCAAAKGLVYASDRDGGADIFLQRDPAAGLEPPQKLAPHSARDRWPRLDRRGRHLLFVSTRDDSAGDIWMLRFPTLFSGLRSQKLTGSKTADDQPCWHPDGDRIFYASSPSLGQTFDLWEMRPGKEPVRLTQDGGQMPDCSPDGRHLVYVSSRASDSPDIWVMRLEDRVAARLTSGPELDLYPCWSSDGTRVFFSRAALDTNGDGRLDQGDASAIFSVSFSEDLFGGKEPPVRQLTSYAASASFPRPLPGGFLFTRLHGSGNTDVFALGQSGAMPDLRRLSEFMEFARRVEQQEQADVYGRMLAWQNVLWAARTARAGGEVEPDLSSQEEAAVAWLYLGRGLVELGRPEAAREAFRNLVAEYPSAHRYVGLARAELLALERLELASGAAGLDRGGAGPADQSAWQSHLTAARELAEEFSAYVAQAGVSEEAEALEETCALAELEIGQTHLARKDYVAALDVFGAVPAQYPRQREACVRSLLATADVYRLLNDPEAVRSTYLKAVTTYPEVARYAALAASRAVDTIVRPEAGFEERLAGLRQMVEQYADVPVLPALAQNYIGDLFYAQKEYLRAVEEYSRTIERFPHEAAQVAAAYLAIGRIRTEQKDYEQAVDVFRRMETVFQEAGGWLYSEARRGYVNSLLIKAERDLRLGDAQLALGTYARLLEFDQSLAAAHRGLVQCYAGLGRVDEAILLYRQRVESRSGARDHLAHYALALAYSYYGPSDWVGDAKATKLRTKIDLEALQLTGRAILVASEVPYYHQLRGFLLSRLALTTGEAEYKVRALDAYLAALGLSCPEDDEANYANLLFNVGEGYMLVEQPESAYEYYRRAVAAGFPFAGERGETGLIQISRSAMAAGDYQVAARSLQRALEVERELSKGSSGAVASLRRQAEVLDRLALAYHLDGDYANAVAQYRVYAGVVERLIAEDREAAPGYRRNLLRAHRNLAVNLYLAVEQGQAEPQALAEACALLKEAAERLDSVGVVEWSEAEQRPGLITIDLEVALGRRRAPAEFDVNAEKRLLYTYLARLSAAAGNYAEAVGFLKRKVALYPPFRARGEQSESLTEQGVVWTQIGAYELARGDVRAATEAYRQAVALENRAGNLEGEAASAVSLGRAVLQMAELPGRTVVSEALLRDAVVTHRALLERIRRGDARHTVPVEAALQTNLAALVDVLALSEGKE